MNIRPLAIVAAIALPAAAVAQSTCKPASSTPEAKLLAFYAGPIAFSAVPGTALLDKGQIVISGELAMMPQPPSSIARSSGACGFNKSENSELAPVFPRPRISIGAGNGFVVEASILPPLTVMDATPHLGGLAVSWTKGDPLPFLGARLTLRAHTTFGGVDGPITCPKDELQETNENAPCYGGTPSKDTYEPNVRGVEAIVAGAGAGVAWHAGAGVNALGSRLLVSFVDGRGFLDNNVVQVTLSRVALLGGASWAASPTLALSAQVYSVPSDATTARLGLAWRVR